MNRGGVMIVWAAVSWLAFGSAGLAQDTSEGAVPTLLAAAEAEARKEAEAAPAPVAPARGPQPSRPREPDAIPKPRLAGSATGYVENAFIGSQVRVRFDSGFGIGIPDRAEMFYAKCGCYRLAGIDPDAPGPVPPFAGGDPTNVPLIENDMDYRDFQFYGEWAPNARFSVFTDVPIRSLSPSIIPEATGIGDMRAGVRLGLVASDTTALTFLFRGYMPTGDSEKGLGTDHGSVEFGLLYSGTPAERFGLGAQFTAWYPVGGSSAVPVSVDEDWAGNVLTYGLGMSYDLVGNPGLSFAPVAELFGWHIMSGYGSVTPDGTPGKARIVAAEGTDVVNLKLGGRVTFNGRHSIYAGYGFPLTDSHLYDDILRVEYRLAF